MKKPEHEIILERTVQAGAGDIFAAFTIPSLLNRWMTRHAESELRVGGAYRYELDGPEGAVFVHKGKFLVLEPGARLRQTFAVESDEENPYTDEFIELSLLPVSSGRTRIRFVNAWNGPGMDDESLAAVTAAWEGWLDQLEKFLALVAAHEGDEEAEDQRGAGRAVLKIVRTFDASPARVFDAWVNLEIAGRWLFFSDGERVAFSLEAQEGGGWVIAERRDGVEYRASGHYLAVDRPRHLAFTYAMPQFSPNSDTIAVTFAAAGQMTLMSFEESGPDIEEELRQTMPGAAGGSEAGWNAMFDTLAQVLGAPGK